MKEVYFRGLEFAEKACQWAQGKGYGAATLSREVGAALKFIPDKDAVVLDIGANHGDWTRILLQRAGGRVAKVFAFEPSAHNHSSIQAINDSRVVLVPCAVSNEKGAATLHYDKAGSGLASLTKRRLDHFSIDMNIEESIETTTLDDFLADQRIDRVDFAKLDIEGHELAALNGARNALSAHKIRALSFEFGGGNIDTRTYFQDFWYFLTERDYKIARINPLFAPVVIEKYTEALETFRTTNLLAFVSSSL